MKTTNAGPDVGRKGLPFTAGGDSENIMKLLKKLEIYSTPRNIP